MAQATAEDPIRAIINEYFDLELDSFSYDAVPEREDLWRLHRDLAAAYRRIDAQTRLPKEPLGPVINPYPTIEIAIRNPENADKDPEVHYFSLTRHDAEILISCYHDQPYQEERNSYRTYVRIVPEHTVPEGTQIEDSDWYNIRYDLALCEMS